MQLTIKSSVEHDNFTKYVCEKFDLNVENEIVTMIPMIDENELKTFNWNVGLICGNSGSGKTTVLSHLGSHIIPTYDMSKSIISQFPSLSEEEAVELLCGVGLSSVPTWLHKPNELSNGEKARFDLCFSLYNSLKDGSVAFIDEFTSVVNRDCAKSLSHALQRFVRGKGMKVVLASCHFDIIEWLKPDWVFNLNKQSNGKCELEHLVYKDSYDAYKMVDGNEILSKEYEIA